MKAVVCDLCGEIIDYSTCNNVRLKVKRKNITGNVDIDKSARWVKIDAHPSCMFALIRAARERSEK